MTDEPIRGAVPVPNWLFDIAMVNLTDTELRILLTTIRQTVGWRITDQTGKTRYRHRDWITHRQLVLKTGRASASVSTAVQSLIDKKLLRVEDAAGRLLDTPQLRRMNLGKTYFRVDNLWIPPRISLNSKLPTTTYRQYNKQ